MNPLFVIKVLYFPFANVKRLLQFENFTEAMSITSYKRAHMDIPKKSALICAMAMALASCGGGGGGGSGDEDPPTQPSGGNNTPPSQAFLPCINTEAIQCSGSTILETNNSIALTDSGVQVYGKSTSDTDPTRQPGDAWGLAPDSGGVAEIRLEKNADGDVVRSAMILSNIGLNWNGTTTRPPIVEVFSNQQGRVQITGEANRPFLLSALPASNDLSFYDWASKGMAGTQENYANNYYFPRTEPIRCDTEGSGCPKTWAEYVADQTPKFSRGPWRTNPNPTPIQTAADEYGVMRYHEDGDLRAGDDLPGPNGERRCIECDEIGADGKPRNSGFGVSYPGFKGYRELYSHNFEYVNLANWSTQDTVNIVEWTGNVGQEHNKDRRGFVAFGNVTPASSIPTSGTAIYRGAVYGSYADRAIATAATQDAKTFRGIATITVDFALRTVDVVVTQTRSFEAEATATWVPSTLRATTRLGDAGTSKANYFTGPAAYQADPAIPVADLPPRTYTQGGLGGRFFGPVTGNGPAELGGTFLLSGTAAGETVIAGFIARKQ
jgi:hypothetical protein